MEFSNIGRSLGSVKFNEVWQLSSPGGRLAEREIKKDKLQLLHRCVAQSLICIMVTD